MPGWAIESIDVTGGFLPGLSLKLPRGLVCIIGPRGSGKSTLIEAIRHAMAGLGRASRARADLIQANLGSAITTLRTTPDSHGVSYVVRRVYKEAAAVATAEGRPLKDVDLDRGTFLPLDGYSSAEIEEIADESLGDKRRVLLDDLRAEELRGVLAVVGEQKRALEANADAIKAAGRHLADLSEQIEELGDARAKLAALPPASREGATAPLVKATKQEEMNAREARAVSGWIDGLARFGEEFHQLTTKARAKLSEGAGPGESANAELLEQAGNVARGAAGIMADQAQLLRAELEKAGRALRDVQVKLQDAHAKQRQQHDLLKQENLAATAAIQERAGAEEAVSRLGGLEEQRAVARRELERLTADRATLKARYLLEREKISLLRESVANDLQKEAGAKMRIRVLRNADDLNYQQALNEGLRGARVRNHEEIMAGLMRLRPEQLAQLIQENDVQELESQLSLGSERSRKILEAFRQNIDALALEVVEIEDRICIELNVSPGAEVHFKDASDLSRGQKCTALLPLLLARRETPLVIDQPEDNLDNHFIYETVVESIRRMKPKRQMIFVTHNANIPVLAEADLVVVMGSDGKKAFVEKAGSLDHCREEIIDLLEGGKEAFELRRQRYVRR